MRSQLVFEASRVIPNRFLLAALLSKGTRAFHRPRTRLAGTVNLVLDQIAASGSTRARPVTTNTNKCVAAGFRADHRALAAQGLCQRLEGVMYMARRPKPATMPRECSPIRCPKCGYEFEQSEVGKPAIALAFRFVCVECRQEVTGTPLQFAGAFVCRGCVAEFYRECGPDVVERECRKREAGAAQMLDQMHRRGRRREQAQ